MAEFETQDVGRKARPTNLTRKLIVGRALCPTATVSTFNRASFGQFESQLPPR